MIERILKHMNIYREMKNAAIPLKLNITVQMYPCSEGTDTDSPAL